MPVKVRPLEADDKPAVMAILRNTPEFKPIEVEVAGELIDAYLEDPKASGYDTLVAEIDGTVVGYICYGPTPLTVGTWDVYWMAVNRQLQGQGIGRALLEKAEADIKARGGRLIMIETSGTPLYVTAQRFYQARHYELATRIADFYEPGDDLLVFMKRLK